MIVVIAFEAPGVAVVHAAARWEIAGTSPCDAISEFTTAAPHPSDVPFPCQRGPDLLTANPRVTYRRLHHAHSFTKEEVAEPIQVLRCRWERIYRSLRL